MLPLSRLWGFVFSQTRPSKTVGELASLLLMSYADGEAQYGPMGCI